MVPVLVQPWPQGVRVDPGETLERLDCVKTCYCKPIWDQFGQGRTMDFDVNITQTHTHTHKFSEIHPHS